MLTHPMQKIGKLVSIIAMVMMAFTGISACAQSSSGGGGNTPAQNPVKIGVSVSETSDFSSDGKALLQGYQIWVDEVNKRGGLLYASTLNLRNTCSGSCF